MAKEKLMKKAVLLVLLFVILIPVYASAQQSGAFVGSISLGLSSAQGDFSDSRYFEAGSGFGFGGEIRYFLLNGFAIGGLANYNRFGSSYPSTLGRTSFTFSQLGGLARLNVIHVSGGAIFLSGGGGVFTPSVHFYQPDNSVDQAANKSGTFAFGGIGLSSATDQKIIYEIELKYNMGRDDFTLDNRTSNVWDFIYFGMKVSFASKGHDAPPKY
jgi:hypothetical protein